MSKLFMSQMLWGHGRARAWFWIGFEWRKDPVPFTGGFGRGSCERLPRFKPMNLEMTDPENSQHFRTGRRLRGWGRGPFHAWEDCRYVERPKCWKDCTKKRKQWM